MQKIINWRKWLSGNRIACVVTMLLSLEMIRTHAYSAAIILLVLSVGLFYCMKWARVATMCILWTTVALLPFIFNPFADAESARAGRQPIPFDEKVAIMVVGEAVCLYLVHSLQKDKAKFR